MTKIQMIVEGGKASPTPQIAQTLGPMKIPINQVIEAVNQKTAPFQGIKIPVEILVNDKDKTYTVTVGSPPTAELIKKEFKLEKGSGRPNKDKIANIAVEDVIKIAAMKIDGLLDKTLKSAVKTVAGSCNSLGMLIEGKISSEFNRDLEAGKYNKELQQQKTDVSKEKRDELKQQLTTIQDYLKREEEKAKLAEQKALEEKAAAAAAIEPTAEEKKAEEKKKGAAAPAAPGAPAAAPEKKAEEKKEDKGKKEKK